MEFYGAKRFVAILVLILFLFIFSFTFIRLTGYSILGGGSAGGSVNLFWVDNSGNEDGFSVERADFVLSQFIEIANVSADIVIYIDSAVVAGETYFYRIRAFNSIGFSAYSSIVNVTVPTNGSNVSTSIPPSGSSSGGGGGSGGGSGSGGITGGVILGNDSLGREPQSSGENSSGESVSSSNSQNSGSSTISGRIVGADVNLVSVSKIGLIILIAVVSLFLIKFLYQIFKEKYLKVEEKI